MRSLYASKSLERGSVLDPPGPGSRSRRERLNKPPAFQFFPRDWLTSRAVTIMSPTQRGYYINLLAHAWLADVPGTLPNDPTVLWQLAGARRRADFERDGGFVLEQFRRNKSGKLIYSERMIQERQAQKRRNLEKSDAGRRGASARWNNKLDGSRIVLPLAENGSASAFAFASASANLKPKTPLPPVARPATGEEQFFDWGGQTVAVTMGRRRRLPNLSAYSGGRAADVVEFLGRRGFRARIVSVQ
jgi:uncharacterized protein YdaU (DUF1376 family)